MASRLVELLRALDLLGQRSGGTTIKGLMEHLGMDKRSVYRLLDLIHEIGVPVYLHHARVAGMRKRKRIEKRDAGRNIFPAERGGRKRQGYRV